MKNMLVTGASKGIGRATALALARDGFAVFIHYHHDHNGAETTRTRIAEAGGNATLLQFDIGNRHECRDVLERTITDYGAFYGIICNAGICRDTVMPAMSDEDWDGVIHTNLDGFYNVISPCLMPMIQQRCGGRIVTLSSVSGQAGNRGQVNYSAAKAGIIGATKALALEVARRNITVNCVAPGLIDTDMTADADQSALNREIPMRRFGHPEEVAALISYLCSPAAAYVTRQVIGINGGLL